MESALGVSSIPSNAPTLRFYLPVTPNFFSTRESVRAHHSSPNGSLSCSSSDKDASTQPPKLVKQSEMKKIQVVGSRCKRRTARSQANLDPIAKILAA
ncbi:hypothetical protein Sjap_002521 [Stephania japonica]|uniref:Uncharacterized protein n=1 Tax=Stephania japonica TaxID=461633 RepID=A0AAP0KM89_9MAGN